VVFLLSTHVRKFNHKDSVEKFDHKDTVKKIKKKTVKKISVTKIFFCGGGGTTRGAPENIPFRE
jgi:hypothetical protein